MCALRSPLEGDEEKDPVFKWVNKANVSKQSKFRAVVVVQVSACLPSTLAIRV